MIDATLSEALYQVLSRLEARWLPPPPSNAIFHAYDPLPLALFVDGLPTIAAVAPGRRFLDVGCGLGTKLALMHHLGWDVAGIERHLPYAEIATEFIPEADIMCRDAFAMDWFNADVVYMYRPCVDDMLELALETHVLARMNPGALLWLPARTLGRAPEREELAPNIWRV